MSESKAAPGFPYDHLAVLGFEKLRRYVPPTRPSVTSKSQPPADRAPRTASTPPPGSAKLGS